jgi:hypothetical protein
MFLAVAFWLVAVIWGWLLFLGTPKWPLIRGGQDSAYCFTVLDRLQNSNQYRDM